MQVRQPQISLDDVMPAWFENADFAHTLNAYSEGFEVIGAAQDPPFLHAVLDRAVAT